MAKTLKASEQKTGDRSPGHKKQLSAPRNTTLNLRVRSSERELIDQAARAVGKNRSDFVLGAARCEAEAVLLDRRLVGLDEKAYREFQSRLDAPPSPRDELRELLFTKSPWK